MGKRGPKAKPTATKTVNGNPGRRPLNKCEPKPRGRATCPSWLTADAEREWQRLSPEMERLDLLTMADRSVFAAYCQSVADYAEAVKALAKTGTTYVFGDAGRVCRHPNSVLLNEAFGRMLKAAAEFGLSPSSRSGIVAPGAKDKQGLDEFVASKPSLRLAHG